MNSKEAMKSIWNYLWGYKYTILKWTLSLYVAYICLAALASCTAKVSHINKVSEYVESLNPEKLREEVNRDRATWVNTCVNNGAAGVLGGATISAEAIEACKLAGFELYPEKDWAQLAKNNHSEVFEKALLDGKNEKQ